MINKLVLICWVCMLSIGAMAQETEIIAALEKRDLDKPLIVNTNTNNYDLVYNRLELEVDPAVQYISGDVTAYFKAKENLNSIVFDLADNLNVTQVMQRGNPLSFTHSEDELVINLFNTLYINVLDSITITYQGVPQDQDDSFVTHYQNGTPALFTLSQPYGAMQWWPCKQDLNDKIDSIDIFIKAPAQYTAVANGVEKSIALDGLGKKTTHFKHNYPIPAYLVAIAVTNYQVYEQTVQGITHTFPIVNYLYPTKFQENASRLEVTLPIMNLFENLFGAYPYAQEKYGHAQFGWGGGMEHTTVSFMGSFGRSLIAHELAHHWFGNKITCGSWSDVWINEGFATYSEGLVVEHLDGQNAFAFWKANRKENITELPWGSLYVEDTLNVNRVFSSRLSYNKGAMVVNMLRFKLGDATFFQGIKNYLSDVNLAYKYAYTADVKSHLEAVSGMDLEEFFQDWVYGQGYPIYDIKAYMLNNNTLQIRVRQSQSHNSVSYFEMPVPVRLHKSNGTYQDVVLDNTYNGQIYEVPVDAQVVGVEFDPNNDIISAYSSAYLEINEWQQTRVQVVPNPAQGSFEILLPDDVVFDRAVLYGIDGKALKQFEAGQSLDISEMSAGTYVLEVYTNRGNLRTKLIK